MSNKKSGSTRVKFGEVVRLVRETCKDPVAAGIERVLGLEHLEPGALRIRSWGQVADGTTFTTRVRPGQVLFGKRRAYQRKVAVAEFDAICSGDIYVFESANPEKLLPGLLPFLCQTDGFFDHAVGTSAGSLSPRTNWSELAEYEFALPPIDEQHRLTHLLAAAEAVRCAAEEVMLAARCVLASSYDHHFSQIPFVEWQPLSSATTSATYGPRFPGDNYAPDGNVRTIRTTDMPEDGIIHFHTAPAANVPLTIAQDHAVQNGDFLISRTGFTSGRAAVVKELPANGPVYIPAAFLIRIRLRHEVLLPDYFLAFLQSFQGTQLVRGLQRGTQQLNISASALLSRSVPIPHLTAQQSALKDFGDVTAAVQAATQRAEMAKNLLASLVASTLGAGVNE